jgi:hypothetical protein
MGARGTGYRFGAVRNLNLLAIQRAAGREPSVWWASLEGALVAFDDLGCAELVG